MSRRTLFVDVLLPLAVPNLYTYRVPFDWNETMRPGLRVMVQFGKSKFYSALVRKVHETPPAYTAKYIEEVLDTQPLVNETQFNFWEWMSAYYMCTAGEVMGSALPSGLKLSSETKILKNTEFNASGNEIKTLSDNEFVLLEALEKRNVLTFHEAGQVLSLKNPQTTIRQLLAKKLIVLYEEVKEKYKIKLISLVRLSDQYAKEEQLKELMDGLEKKAFRQLEVLLFYLNFTGVDTNVKPEWIKRSELLRHFDAAAINSLIKKGVFEQKESGVSRIESDSEVKEQKALSALQGETLLKIKESFKTHDVCLLHGITGSGKTEIYCLLMDEVIANGKQVLYLVPEIALTTQLVSRVKKYFGDKMGVYHSRFSDNERVEIWNAVLGKGIQVVLGARSALLLPFSEIGLIIIDEEHDSSYKQHDPAPRYHARDAAIYLATLHKAKVLLGTATPCIESYFNAQENRYGLVNLEERFGDSVLPEVSIVDSRSANEETGKEGVVIGATLLKAISETIAKKEQVILFQNRRGFAPYTECATCGHVPCCVQCDVSLIYHKVSQKLTCHYCGYTTSPPPVCTACGSPDLRYKGFGTQKIEEELELVLPEARVKRMDIDSTRNKHAYSQIIQSFDDGEIDILVGTQMVTKGLDFDHVGLVGVLQADHLMSYPDFRSHERAFQLMTQVSGRAGRKKAQGKVLIQSGQPANKILDWVIRHDYKSMYENLLAERQSFLYPPYTRLINFMFISKQYDLLNAAADNFGSGLRKVFAHRVLGPEYPVVSKIKNEYHKHILLKVERNLSPGKVREHLKKLLSDFRSDKTFSVVKLKIDVDPY